MATRDLAMSFDSADDANVPVDVWLMAPEAGEDEWELRAANYMPRKDRVQPEAYITRSTSKEELQSIVRDKILPLYRIAVAKLEAITTGDDDHLYYWE